MIVRSLTCLALAGLALPLASHSRAAQDAPPEQQPDEPEQPPEPVDARTQLQREMAEIFFGIADYNGDGWISFREARQSLELDRTRFHAFDADGDGRITLEEFTAQYLRAVRQVGAFKPPIPNPDDPGALTLEELLAEEQLDLEGSDEAEPVAPLATNVLELFGQVVSRDGGTGSSPEPDQIVGPVPSFRRIDYDNDGGISRADLVELGRGSSLDIRVNTLLAALDSDGDGVISEEEFLASMRHAH